MVWVFWQVMKAWAATEHMNQRVAAEVGYAIAKKKYGKDFTFAKGAEFAKDFMRSATFAGGRANRPQLQGQLGTLGNMAYSFQQYTLGWLSNLTRYIQHWKGAEYLNLTPEQRTNARKAATTLLGIQLASAGMLGMPFVGAALKLLEKTTDKDLTGNLYASLAKLFNEDENEDGGGLTDVMMSGAANALFANAGVPIDIGARLGIQGALGFDARSGFSSDGVFGPTSQIVARILAGIKSTVGGDFGTTAAQLSPNGIRKAVTIWKNGGEVLTGSGRNVGATEIEKYAYAAGFNPQKLTKLNQFEAYKRQAQIADEAENARDIADILGALQSNPALAQVKLRQASERSGGIEQPRDIALRVAKAAAEKVFPVDVRKEMTGRSAQHLANIAKALGVSIPQAHEVAQSSYINEVMGQLGMRGVRPNINNRRRDELGTSYSPFALAGR